MFVVTAVFISVVSGIHLSTTEIVALNERLYIREAVLYAAGIEIPDSAEAITEKFNNRVNEKTDYFELLDSAGNVDGYAILIRGAGLWGEIRAILAFESDLETIRGIEFIAQNETPGLGARITENWFKEQFRGKTLPLELVPEDTADEENEIDGITGATVSSTSVMGIIRDGVEKIGTVVE
jgi:Na+-transporting NADH:ubiquinone oxidoreductase subunit C